VWNIYRELYHNAEPSVNFDELFENAEINELGQRVIPFENYFIYENLAQEIVEKHLKGKRLTPLSKSAIKANVYLGCAPMFKKEEKCKQE
jgi:hypothetical protein